MKNYIIEYTENEDFKVNIIFRKLGEVYNTSRPHLTHLVEHLLPVDTLDYPTMLDKEVALTLLDDVYFNGQFLNTEEAIPDIINFLKAHFNANKRLFSISDKRFEKELKYINDEVNNFIQPEIRLAYKLFINNIKKISVFDGYLGNKIDFSLKDVIMYYNNYYLNENVPFVYIRGNVKSNRIRDYLESVQFNKGLLDVRPYPPFKNVEIIYQIQKGLRDQNVVSVFSYSIANTRLYMETWSSLQLDTAMEFIRLVFEYFLYDINRDNGRYDFTIAIPLEVSERNGLTFIGCNYNIHQEKFLNKFFVNPGKFISEDTYKKIFRLFTNRKKSKVYDEFYYLTYKYIKSLMNDYERNVYNRGLDELYLINDYDRFLNFVKSFDEIHRIPIT